MGAILTPQVQLAGATLFAMIATRLAVTILAVGVTIGPLIGCGNPIQTTAASTTAMPTMLAGSWLLAGAMPTSASLNTSALSITATFDVHRSIVTGIVQVQVPCPTYGALGSPLAVQGIVATDGSFTLTSVVLGGLAQSFTLQGNIPSVAGGAWSGNFSFTNSNTTCPGTTNGAVAATAIAPVTCTYLGTATLGSLLNGLVQSVPLNFALEQGGTPAGSSVFSNLYLAGALTVSNSTCITSGTASGILTPVSSRVLRSAPHSS